MPSEAAKKAKTCLMKCLSSSFKLAQWVKSPAKSISSAVQKLAMAFLYILQMSSYLIGRITNLKLIHILLVTKQIENEEFVYL